MDSMPFGILSFVRILCPGADRRPGDQYGGDGSDDDGDSVVVVPEKKG